MQGFYVSEPMGDADFAALLRRHKQL
jgi:hypothetical protein